MSSALPEVLFSRPEHGSFPIRIRRDGPREVYDIESKINGVVYASYTTPQQLIVGLTWNPTNPMSFDEYFERTPDRASFHLPAKGSTIDLFSDLPSDEIIVHASPTFEKGTGIQASVEQQTLTIDSSLGIDLTKRGHEVRKLLFAGFGMRIATNKYDPDDVLQEVFRGILARNRGKCPFDKSKSSFGHYVHMVAECILNNYHRREKRRLMFEQVGMHAPTSLRDDCASGGTVDVAVVAERVLRKEEDATSGNMDDAIRRMTKHLEQKRKRGFLIDQDMVHVARMLVEGQNRREIADSLRITNSRLTSMISSLREHMTDW